MGLFSSIKDAIFGSPEAHSTVTPAVADAVSPTVQDQSASTLPKPDADMKSATTTLPVDVDATLAALAAKNGQQLNYRTSIVDLLKLLGLDSSLSNRKSLAKELGYAGSEEDSAVMNTWLHAEVMTKLAADGGVVPDDWKH